MKTSILNKFNGALETIRKNSDIYSEILNNSTNLKLYELSRLEDLEESSFNMFCLDNYNVFTEYLDELNLTEVHIGTTSSFYLNSIYFDMYEYHYQGQMNVKKIVYLICEHSGIDTDYIKIEDDGLISDLEDIKLADGSSLSWKEYFLEEHDLQDYVIDLISSVESFTEEINSIRKGYEYIDNFKNNQIELFKEWQEC